jgi:PilZ domain
MLELRKSPAPKKTPTAMERRRAKRHRIAATVRWSGGEGVTRNLSATGLLFDTAAPPAAGRVLKMALDMGPGVKTERRQYAFCEIMVLRVMPNGDGAFRVAAAFKTSPFRAAARPR